MPAPLHIVLTPEAERTLSELRVARSVSQRTRDRAHMLRLNAQGWTVPAIAKIFECQENTVRQETHQNQLAQQSEQILARTGKITVIVQDNGSSHTQSSSS